MNGSIAHECTSGDQLIFSVNVCFINIRVHMLAAHLLHSTCCLSIWPPKKWKSETKLENKILFLNNRHLVIPKCFLHTFHTLCPVPQWAHSQAGSWQQGWGRCSTCPVASQLYGKLWWTFLDLTGWCSLYSSPPSHSGSLPHQSPLNENTQGVNNSKKNK